MQSETTYTAWKFPSVDDTLWFTEQVRAHPTFGPMLAQAGVHGDISAADEKAIDAYLAGLADVDGRAVGADEEDVGVRRRIAQGDRVGDRHARRDAPMEEDAGGLRRAVEADDLASRREPPQPGDVGGTKRLADEEGEAQAREGRAALLVLACRHEPGDGGREVRDGDAGLRQPAPRDARLGERLARCLLYTSDAADDYSV